jgi:adenosylmethionine-8-amino-7-oxononanoate aminotransferase
VYYKYIYTGSCPLWGVHGRLQIQENTFYIHEHKRTNSICRDVSTFGACTGGMAAALVNLEILEREELVKNAQVHP